MKINIINFVMTDIIINQCNWHFMKFIKKFIHIKYIKGSFYIMNIHND